MVGPILHNVYLARTEMDQRLNVKNEAIQKLKDKAGKFFSNFGVGKVF